MKELGSNKNFLALPKEYSNYDKSGIVFVFSNDGKTTSNFKTIESILFASGKLNWYDEEQGIELCKEVGIATLEPINVKGISQEKAQNKIANKCSEIIHDKKFIVCLSSNHSTPLAVVKAFSKSTKEFTFLRLGANADLEPNKTTNSSDFVNKISKLTNAIVQIGIRKESKEENLLRLEKGIKTFYTREIKLGMYGNKWQELIAGNIKGDIFLSIDLNYFDPTIFNTVTRPEPGGMFWDETLNLLKIISIDNRIIGIDINGFGTTLKNNPFNYYAAKFIYKLLNYSFINR